MVFGFIINYEISAYYH